MSGNFLSRHELKRNNISRIISRDASVNQWRLLNTFKPTETEKEENHRHHKKLLHVSETERSWMETTSEHSKMLRKKWAKNVELKGTEWKQLASFQKSLLCRDTTGTAVTEQEIEAALHNRPLLVTIRYGPLLSWYLKSTRYRKQSILKKEAVPLYTETNDLGSRKSMDVEMQEPWSMKQAHKNVAYKWNRTKRSLISKINKGRDSRAMSNEAST